MFNCPHSDSGLCWDCFTSYFNEGTIAFVGAENGNPYPEGDERAIAWFGGFRAAIRIKIIFGLTKLVAHVNGLRTKPQENCHEVE